MDLNLIEIGYGLDKLIYKGEILLLRKKSNRYFAFHVYFFPRNFCLRNPLKVFEAELTRLRSENSSLKDQLQRSLRELRAYQVKYPSPYIPDRTEEEDNEGGLWTIAPDVINPLLEAYDTSTCIFLNDFNSFFISKFLFKFSFKKKLFSYSLNRIIRIRRNH
jgi:hypothetical protein